jgi:hypothetical protein
LIRVRKKYDVPGIHRQEKRRFREEKGTGDLGRQDAARRITWPDSVLGD